ncbi:GMC oxidoreductase [Pleomassaria siparia CBS 279.74]|uniref:GMC oxidoreductase n=1 Tax=Pleomassaria siparia CBS 279.74 TaxID=1314801 RepID=A0A6G1JSB8_9PLEO|nr:GMC oxidoreductase [Pleomassaria siparia CBS 279.74]
MADPQNNRIPTISASTFSSTRFDYLIIGGGTAALVIAARLSANPTITVGVLEAGPNYSEDPLIAVPGRFGESIGGQYDWNFETVPQSGLNGRSLSWPRGRVLGGTSALNFMTWTRGNREDYDAGEDLGNKGWGWDDMLPFFMKTETLHRPTQKHRSQHHSHHASSYHGTEGPIPTVYSNEYSEPHQYWHATLNNLGLETNRSHFSGSNLGAFTTLTSVYPTTRTRASSATAYYLPNAERKNLHVLTEATVQRVILEDDDGEWVATGAEYICGDERFTARASNEVILCAGSIQSPQILELSGIGNQVVLQAAGIHLKVAIPGVGENLQDHMMTAMIYELDSSLVGPDQIRADPILATAAQEAYKTFQSGMYAMLPSALSYASLAQVIPDAKLQNIRAHLPPPESSRDEILRRQFISPTRGQMEYLFDIGNWSPHFQVEKGKVYGTMLMMLQLPLSKGSIHIPPAKSRTEPPSVNDKPIINPRYFQGEAGETDFQIMSYAQNFADKICRTAPLSQIIKKRVFPPEPPKLPGQEEAEEEDFAPFVRDTTITDWHPIGTCAMGGIARHGVVDERLRVYGVKGLRVADASIMPLHICSHPQATVYAIGEKAASMILEDRDV